MRIFKICVIAAMFFLTSVFLYAGAVMARGDSVSSSQRQGSYRPARSPGETFTAPNVNSPSLAIYDPANIRSFEIYRLENIIPRDNGYDATIGGGRYNIGDTISGGRIKDITSDNIVVEFPKVIVTQGKIDITFKPGENVERPSRKPVAADSEPIGERRREYYETALIEVQENNFDPGVIAKAISDAMGNQDLVTSLYIQYRVDQLDQAYKDALAKKNETARKAALRAAQESKTITIVTTIDKKTAKIALKYILPLVIAALIAWGIFIFTEWSKKW